MIFVCDGSAPLDDEDRAAIDACLDAQNSIALINKADLPQKTVPSDLPFMYVIPICAKTGEGLDLLADTIDTIVFQELDELARILVLVAV